ncbi:DUF1961 family protein [Ruania alba]|uniref:DUF1961 family protein n=1 Tax=Ruania alba TaxID=648782 RepID=A0A1H5M724_9MICO|nr:DUF1961 family protein [Ruania alba]SEE85075.1 protein of unknown function [Ruania alba]
MDLAAAFSKGELLYSNDLRNESDIAGFRLEGDGAVTFPLERMRLESTRSAEEGQDANLVLWCNEEFDDNVAIEWKFWPVREPGLAILFFAARGRGGDDVFDPDLAPRTGRYEQYHSGDINAYHVSYFRRRAPHERAFHTCNLRKSHGFHLVAQGADPLPPVSDARPPYRMQIVKQSDTVVFAIDGLISFTFTDDGSVGGPPHDGGRIGFRQMAPMIGEYADLTVRRLPARTAIR